MCHTADESNNGPNLVLGRRVGQKIIIGGSIVIEVLEIIRLKGENPRVRLGVSAPRDVKVSFPPGREDNGHGGQASEQTGD